MKHNQNRRIFRTFYAATASLMLLSGFTSLAAEPGGNSFRDNIAVAAQDKADAASQENKNANAAAEWNLSDIAGGIQGEALESTKAAAEEAREAYLLKIEEEKKAAEEAARIAAEQAAAEAAAAAQAQAAEEDRRLLAALIFCEAGNQPYEGQVAVGAVVMNRVNSGVYPNTIREVIYQSGQFTPAMTGWLDSVLASGGYTDSAMQAAADALAGSDPVEGCLYFSTGGWGTQIGDHYFH